MRRRLGLLLALAIGCGPSIPEHNGYKRGIQRPWTKAKRLELEEGEAEVDDIVSYPKRMRARWYAIDVPEFGELALKLTYSSTALAERRGLDLAFEVFDEGYTLLVRADRSEDDAGDESKSRTLYELDPGRYFVHVYLQRRLDAAEFTLSAKFASARKEYESNFPARVAYLPILPAVPATDDTPVAEPVRKKCEGCKKTPEPPPEVAVRARIAEATVSGAGTRIKINKGSSAGIQQGWKGSVITSGGARIPDGSFTVEKVSETESYASVRATKDAVNSAKYVRLRPP